MDISLSNRIQSVIENISDFPIPGVQFKDITPIFSHPELYKSIIDSFAEFSREKVDVVCGLESRGYLFGVAIAIALEIPFVLIRKKGKLPPPTVSQAYSLEYGTAEIEMRKGQINPGQRVLIHDDLLATGGTAAAAARLVMEQGASVAQFSFLIELVELKGRDKLNFPATELLALTKY